MIYIRFKQSKIQLEKKNERMIKKKKRKTVKKDEPTSDNVKRKYRR